MEHWQERELVRLRDRVHAIANAAQRLELADAELERRLDAVTRDLRTFADDLRVCVDRVDEMTTKDEIADAVAARLEGQTARSFTRWQLWGVRVAIFGAIGGGVAELVRAVSGG